MVQNRVKNKAFIFLFIILFIQCKRVHFNDSFPQNGTLVNCIDSSIAGRYYYVDSFLILENSTFANSKYLSVKDDSKDSLNIFSMVLFIEKNTIFYQFEFKILYNSKITDSITIRKSTGRSPVVEGNFFVLEEKYIDTIINLDRDDKIKQFNKKYYLNHMISEKEWEIIQVIINKDSSIMVNQTNELDEKKLNLTFYTKENEIFGKIAHITNLQFMHFVQNGGFRERFLFKKDYK